MGKIINKWVKLPVSLFSKTSRVVQKSPKIAGILTLSAIVALSVALVLITDDKAAPKSEWRPANIVEIKITDHGFEPATASIKTGTKVIWANVDSSPHQIVANPHPTGESLPELKSEILNQDQAYEFVFRNDKTVEYHDYLNPTFNGTIEVKN